MISKNCIPLITRCECKLLPLVYNVQISRQEYSQPWPWKLTLLFLAVLIKMSKFLSSKVWFNFHWIQFSHQQMPRKHHSVLSCSQSENPAHKELFQSLTGKISLGISLLYTPGLHRLLLKMWNYQLLTEEIQVVSTYCAPGHIQNTFGCMWTRILFRKRTDVTKSTLKHEVGFLAAWWQWTACCACVMGLFTAADLIRILHPVILIFFFLKNQTSETKSAWL